MRLNSAWEKIACVLIILSAGCIVYLNAGWADYLSIDDRGIFSHLNALEEPLSTIFSGGDSYYRPITLSLYLFDIFLFGASPASSHLINVGLHLANSLLVYYLALEMFKDDRFGNKAALVASLLFLLHPVNVEPVLWIASRGDLLCVLFFLLSLIYLVKLGSLDSNWTAFLLFFTLLLSLLSKEASIVMGAIVPIYLLSNAGAMRKRTLVVTASAVFLAIAIYLVMRSSGNPALLDPGVSKVIKKGVDNGYPLSNIVAGYGFYVRKLFYPFSLNFAIHTFDKIPHILVAVLFCPVAVWLYRRSRELRLPLLIICFGIIPPLLAMVGSLPWTPFAERYLYFPMVGFVLLVSRQAFVLTSQAPPVAVLAVVLCLGFPTLQRVNQWIDPVVFWQDTVQKSPRFPRSHIGLSIELIRSGQYDEAERSLNNALAMKYESEALWGSFSEIYLARKDYINYEKAMHKAASVSDGTPTDVLISLAGKMLKVYDGNERNIGYSKAIDCYLEAARKDPDFTEGYYNAAKLYLVMQNREKAIYYFEKFLSLDKNNFFRPFAVKMLSKIKT